MAKKNPKNKNKLFLSFISSFLLLFSLSLIFFQISKKPKEVKAVAGQLNINAVSGGVQNFNQVGIGTTSPQGKLHVAGVSNTAPVRIQGTTFPQIQFHDGTAIRQYLWLDTANGNVITLGPGGTGSGVVVNTAGNVGIGTTSPAQKLDVQGNLALGTATTVAANPTTGIAIRGSTSNFNINIQDGSGRVNYLWNASAGGGTYLVSSEPAARLLQTVNGTTGGVFQFFGAPAGTAGNTITWTQTGELSSNSNVWFSPRGINSDFYINSSGNVGIGTTNPGHKLQVEGNMRVNGNYLYVNSEGAGPLRVGAAWGIKGLYAGDGGTSNLVLGVPGGSYVYLGVSSGDAWVQGGTGNAYFKGNVGIGTTGPRYKLHVIGDIYANGGWLRTSGTAGWYSETYGGGWYMSDTSWIRTYNSKSVWTDTGLLGSNGGLTVGYGGTASPSGGAIIAGNVGIGTTGPTAKLHVKGTAYFEGTASWAPGIFAKLVEYGAGGRLYLGKSNLYNGAEVFITGFGSSMYFDTNGPDALSVWVKDGFLSVDRSLTVKENAYLATVSGRVGIGTWTFASQTRLKVTAPNGAVIEDWPSNWGGGIATWDIVGAGAYLYGVAYRSDFSLKKNIQPINYDALDKVLKLNPVSFYWKDERIDREKHFGFIAQEVEKIFPELVRKDSKGKKSLNYNELIPFLTKSIQEQQLQISASNTVLASYSTRLSSLEKDLNLTSTDDLKIVEQNSKFEVRNSKNDLVTKIAAFAEIIVGKIKAGVIEVKKLVVDGVDIVKKISDLEQKLEKQEQIIRNQQKEIEALKEIVGKLKK